MGLAAKGVNSRRRGPNRNTHARKRVTPTLSKEYQTVFETTGKAMVIVEEDATISLANPEFEKLSGYTKEEIEGKKYWTEFVVRDDRKRVKEYHLLRRTDPILAPRCFEFRFLDRQEKVKNIILTIGQIPGTNKSMASLLDVTDRRQAEEMEQRDKKVSAECAEYQTAELVRTNKALQAEIADLKREVERLGENEKNNRMLIDNIDLSINLIDTDYNIVLVNAAASKQTNKPESKLIGKKCFREFEKRDAVCPHCPGVQAMATGKLVEAEAEGVRDDGSRYKVRIQTFPVFGHDRTITGFIEIVEDITERKRTDKLLQDERETFFTILENALYGVCLTDSDGSYLYVNPEFTAITGYTLEDIPNGSDFFHKAYPDKKYRHKVIATWMKDRGIGMINRVFRVVCKDGAVKEIEFRPTLLPDGRAVVMLADITELKRAEELLRQEKETFSTILQNALYGVALMDSDGKHVYVNPEFTAITGYTLEDIPTGKDWMHKAYPDKAYRQEITELWRGDSKLGGTKRVVSVVCKNGEIKEIETNRTPLENGLSVVMLSDITERKRAEEALRTSEQHYRTLFEESLDGICLADAETGIIIDCNKALADMVCRERAELIGKLQTILHPPQDDREKFSLTFKQHLTDKEGQIIETQVITKTGDIREVEIKANSMNFQGEKLLQGVFRDITERKHAEELLQEEREIFFSILHKAPYGVILIDNDEKCLYLNPEFMKTTGYTPANIPTAKDWMHKAYPDKEYRKKVAETWKHEIIQREAHKVFRVRCRDGKIKDFEFRATRLGDGRVVVMSSDVTERKQTEEALRESEERYRSLADNIKFGINLIDTDHNILMVNTSQSKYFKKPVAELIGKKCFRAFEQRDTVCPHCPGVQAMATGKPVEFEHSGIRKNAHGHYLCMRLQAFPIFKDNGTATGFIEVVEDITERKQMEQRLHASEERFRNLVETMKVGLTTIDEKGVVSYANEQFCTILGYSMDEVIGRPTVDFYYDDETRKFQEKVFAKRKKGMQDPTPYEIAWKTKDGKKVYTIISPTPRFDADGRYIGSSAIQTDITERKKMEKELQESEERFKMLAEHAPLGISIMAPDRSFVYLNPRFTEIFGYTLDDIPDKDTWFEKAYPNKAYREKLISTWKQDTAEWVKTGKENPRVFTVRCKNGQDKIIDFRRIDLKDGKQYQIYDDITDRINAEEALQKAYDDLKKSETRYRILVDNVDLGINLLDVNHTIVMVNAETCKVFNKPASEMIGKKCFREFERRDAVCPHCPGVQAMAAGQSAEVETEGVGYDGSPYTARNKAFPIFGHDGTVTGFIEITENISERKRAEDQLKRYAAELEQSNEEVKNFAYIVSHDLRVPLVNLKGYSAELCSALEVIGSNFDAALPHLNDEKRSTVAMALHEDAPEALEFITNSVSRMDSFINSVLILSRLGRRELKPEPIDMNALVQTNLENLSHQIQERETTVTVGSLPQVVADRTAMEQIMGNILGNAVKYLDPDRPGQIEVTAETNNGEQIFHIRDNGRGIAEEDMHKVFAPFRRAGKQDTPGEGMGLAYVQTLVRRQEGRIWCESELGKGTTFTFTIAHHRAEGEDHVAH